MSRVFDQNQALSRNLETEVTPDEDGAQAILSIMEAYYGDLGLDSRSRTLYILDGETGAYLTGTDEEEGRGWWSGRRGPRPTSPPTIWTWPCPSPGGTTSTSSIFWTTRPR